MRFTMRSVVRLTTAGVAVIIVVLSLLPLPEPPVGDFLLADKIGHAAAYLVLGFLMFAAQLPGPRLRLVLVAVGASVALGGLIELVQPLAQRHSELADLLADVVGSLVGALLALATARRLRRVVLRPGRRAVGPGGPQP